MISEKKHDNSNQVIRHPDKDRVDKNFIIFSHERDHKLFVSVQRENVFLNTFTSLATGEAFARMIRPLCKRHYISCGRSHGKGLRVRTRS